MATLVATLTQRGDYAWGAWLIGTLGSFAVLEALAYRRSVMPTLTRTLQRWLGVGTLRGRASLAGLLGLWIWFSIHLSRVEDHN